ncbi:MAG: O-antigen ligase family protein [Eubacteriales bacterium]
MKDNIKQKSPPGVKAESVFRTSVIVTFFLYLCDVISKGISDSLFGRFFCMYGRENEIARQSFLVRLWNRLNLSGRVVRPLKAAFRRGVEQSAVMRMFSDIRSHLLRTSMKVWGIMLFSFGLYSAIVYFVRVYALSNMESDNITLVCAAVCAFAGIPVMFAAGRFCDRVCESRAMSFILFSVIGIRRDKLELDGEMCGRTNISFILGMLLGLMTYFIKPLYILIFFIGAIALRILLYLPEFGVVLAFFALPFLPTMALVGLVGYTFFCYFLKVMQGRRTFRLDLGDSLVGVFMLMFALGGIFSVTPAASLKSALVYICFMLGYFLCVNLIRDTEWIKRCITAAIGGGLFVSLYGIYENYFGLAQTTWQDEEMFEDISGRVVSTFGNPNVLAEYLIMLLPIALAALLLSKSAKSGVPRFVIFGAVSLCLVFTWSRGAWLGLLIALMLFALIYSRRSLLIIIAGVCAVPFMPFVLPQNIISRFTSIGNMSDTSTAYRVNIWRAVTDMISDFFGGGIGVGGSAFAEVYPSYSLAGIESAPHSHQLYLQILLEIGIFGLLIFLAAMIVFAQRGFTFYRDAGYSTLPGMRTMKLYAASLFCGIVAILAQGMTDYVWYNYRIFLMFWLTFGLCAAICRVIPSGAADERGIV